MPPHQLGPLVARQIGRLDGRETSIFLQDYGQVWLVPLPGDGLAAGEPQPIDGSDAGRAFREARPVEVSQADDVRVYLPLLDGGDQVGVMAVTLDHLQDDERRLLRRLASLVADMLRQADADAPGMPVGSDDHRGHRGGVQSVAHRVDHGHMQDIAVEGVVEAVAGHVVGGFQHPGQLDPGRGHRRRWQQRPLDLRRHTHRFSAPQSEEQIGVTVLEIYTFMDRAVADQFGPDHFVTAQMMRLNTATGRLQWVNAGHPAPVLIRGHRVVRRLEGPTTLPVGFGGHEPRISEVALIPGDRILCFTDGLIEERDVGGEEFSEEQLIGWVNRLEPTAQQIRTVARSLSHTLQRARGGITTDDATLLLIEWRGSATDDLALPE
ncbi:PP2C family protein-serine/threonine phosphatase [Streptomyces sp. NPDC127079]|uniref:PP2C family protein-serine/threonine phosphatase n=1 Tax=Streptomyces sp. NPDC127079 TaxID=3347132 RepID=UPI00366319FC